MVDEIDLKAIKKAEPVVYLRISNQEQAMGDADKPLDKQTTFKTQLKRVENGLKEMGFTGKVKPMNVFREVGSGGDSTRPVWKEAIESAVQLQRQIKKPVVFVVTELSRFSRDFRYGVAEMIPLYENDIPIVATDDRLIVGTSSLPTPDADILLGIKMTLAGGERETVKKKEKSGRKARTQAGIYYSVGMSLWPFANEDPYDWLADNVSKARAIKDGGLGGTKWANYQEGALGKPPMAPSGTWHKRAWPNFLNIKANLDDKEFKEWDAFRRRFRAFEKKEGYDGAQAVGKASWPVKAGRYQFNGYLTKPYMPEFSQKPTNARFEEVISNPQEYLSAGDKKLYRKVVGKRAN